MLAAISPLLLLFMLITPGLSQGPALAAAPTPAVTDSPRLELDVPALMDEARATGRIRLTLQGKTFDLQMTPNNIWRTGPSAMIHDESGFHEADVAVPDVYKGGVLQDAEGKVRLTFSGDWVSGYVYADSAWHFIEPLAWHDETAARSTHVLHEVKDAGRIEGIASASDRSSASESQLLTVDIIPYGDVEFYNMGPSDWFARMSAVINDVEGIFVDAVGVQFNIVVGIIWSSQLPDYPLTSTSSSTLLGQLRTYSLENYDHSRHIIHLLTGKDLDGTGLENGYSYPNGLGWCQGYSLAQQADEDVYGASVFEKAIVSANAIGSALDARRSDAIDNAWCWCGGNPGFICRTIMWNATIPDWICRITQFSDDNVARMEAVDDLILGDDTPPDCDISINGGAAYTKVAQVTLDGECSDTGSGVDVYRYGAAGLWEDWVCGAPESVDWTLTGGDGTKTVYLQCRDRSGNQSQCSDTIVLDRTAPNCAMSISGGSPYTKSSSVTLNLSCTDATSGVSRMRFKDSGGAWTSWEAYASTKAWGLPPGDGSKAVYVEIEDGAGNTSQCSDDITLDTAAPTCSIVIDGGETYALSAGVGLDLSSSDSGSGLGQMRFKDEGGSWTSWQAYTGHKSWTLPGADGTKTVYVEFRDNAGNTSQCTDSIVLDTTAPVCSISINAGGDYTNSTSVTLNLSATDAGSGVTEMRFIDEATPWTAWEPYATTKAWTLPSTEGSRVVFVEFKDAVGHTSNCSDKILLDTTGPSCSIAIDGGSAYSTDHSVTLNLDAFDGASGVAEMRFIDESTPWTAWEPYAPGKAWVLPTGEGSKTVFVEFKDSAGNTSNCYDNIVVDTIAPACSIAINGGDATTGEAAVTLDLESEDSGSGVSEMRLKDDGSSWTQWEPYAENREWSLPGDDGLKIVHVEFRDEAGNTSVCSDSIDLDRLVTCSIVIDEGDEYTTSRNVWLALSSSSSAGTNVMRLKNDDGAWDPWEPYAEERYWALSEGDGPKTVHVEFKDSSENTSECSDMIMLDTTPPVCSMVIAGDSAYVADTAVTLSLSASDAGSGLTDMRFRDDGASWSEWEPYQGAKSWTLPAGDGVKTVSAEFRDALGYVGACSDTILLDTTAPACSLAIEAGDAYTDSSEVTLGLYAADSGSGVMDMRFRDEGGVWGPWEAFAETLEWTLLGGDGAKTVYVEYRDGAGNTSVCSDDIELDGTPPTCSIDINGGDEYATSNVLELTLSSEDLGSGVSGMRFKNEGGDWGAWEAYGTSRGWTATEGDGAKTVYVEFADSAGNVSQCYDAIVLETGGPSCSIAINGGAAYTTVPSVALSLSALDPGSGVSGMRFKNAGGEWTEWEPYGEERSWSLPDGDGLAAVHAEFSDYAGNISQCADSIVLDTGAPTCSIVIEGDASYVTSAAVTLTLASGDGGSGVGGMRFSDDGESWTDWEPYATEKTWTLAGDDGTKTVFARFSDAAGNETECSDTITLDSTTPTCSILINEGSAYATSPSAVLNLSSVDLGSGVTEMRFLGGDLVWTNWEPFAATKPWTLPGVDGEHEISVAFRDGAGNISYCTDTITLDTVAPACAVLVASDSAYTNKPDVLLQVAANDGGSGVSDMRITNDLGSWTEWEPYSPSVSWTLDGGDGTRTVYVEIRDAAGLTTMCSDAIVLDSATPAAVTGLEVCALGGTSMDLCWDWGGVAGGSPEYFDIRHSFVPLDTLSWLTAHSDTLLPALAGPGNYRLTELLSDTLYYAGVRVVDDAGNASQISVVSARTPYDTTPPTLTLGVLQNPILTSHLDIYLVGSEPLDEECLLVTAGDDTVAMIRAEGPREVYRGEYTLAGAGALDVCATACDLVGLAADTCRSFSSAYISVSEGGVASSLDGALNVRFGPGDVGAGSYVLVYKSETDAAYTISPPGLAMSRSVEIKFHVDREKDAGAAIFKWTGSGWKEIPSYWDEISGGIVAYVASLGTYQVRSNGTPWTGENALLRGPYPNPFTSETRVFLNLPKATVVEVSIFDVRGRLVRRLVPSRALPARSYVVAWDGRTEENGRVPSGVYFMRVKAGDRIVNKRLIVAR
jgi:hypothetical protein